MPIAGIREVDVDSDWEPSGDTIGDIVIDTWDARIPEDEFPSWSFSGEEVIRIEFEYSPTASFGKVEPLCGFIEVRKGSGLLFVFLSEGTNEVDQIIRELRTAACDDLRIKKRFVIERGRIWQFLMTGRPQKVEVVTPFGGVQRVSLTESGTRSEVTLDDARGSYPIDLAKIQFSPYGNDFDIEFFEDKLNIKSSSDDDIEYVIQAFESAVAQ